MKTKARNTLASCRCRLATMRFQGPDGSCSRWVVVALTLLGLINGSLFAGDLPRLKYNHPGLTVDLGVGLWAWPLPFDYDEDGDLDLVVSCPDVPYRGTYLFENPGKDEDDGLPVFKPRRKIGDVLRNVGICCVDGQPRILTPAKEVTEIRGDLSKTKSIYPKSVLDVGERVRANQWSYVDYDGDGALDIVVGHGLWSDYGWDNAFDKQGNWTHGRLHGHVYLLRNKGTTDKPEYEPPAKIVADGQPVDVFGMPSPNFADFDSDGDLDLLCGEFIDGFTYFQNIGTRNEPQYAAGKKLTRDGKPLTMHLCMIVVTSIDWDHDGDVDLVVGQEDGRVAFVEHTGEVKDGMPVFAAPKFFQQQADDVKFGALVTPVSFDWDADGDEDLICGNTAGEIGFIENLDGKHPPKWAAPKLLEIDGEPIRILAGPNGSIQGPAEAKWGYTTISVADWDHDDLPDIIANSIWGKVVWYRNVGKRGQPKLSAAQPIDVQWKGVPPKPAWNWWNPRESELATQWRTTPCVLDWNRDGLNDLVMLDHEGYLAFFQRERRNQRLILRPGERIFRDEAGKPLRLNAGAAGKSGRRKLAFADWDSDGDFDLLINSVNVNLLRNISEQANAKTVTLADEGPLHAHKLAGHTTSPTTVDWDGDGKRDLLIGAEDGYFYSLPASETTLEKGKVSLRVAELTVNGRSFALAKLDDGEQAFANRNYIWQGIPKELKDWRYTQTGGGERASIVVTAHKATTLSFATAVSQTNVDVKDWKESPLGTFAYTDRNRTRLQIYTRNVNAGQRVVIPQGNWTGGLLLLPPESNAKKEVSTRRDNDDNRPNVLFIAVDDMRVELGCYGHSHINSPNIDRLATQGTLFLRAYCQQAVCNPSRASLLTGLRLDTLGIWDLPTHFRDRRPNVVTLPQLFKNNGYHTQNIGKIFHNWRQDEYKGDPKSWSVPAVLHYNTHGADKAVVKGELPPDGTQVPRTEMRDVPDDAYFDGRVADKAIAALRELREERFFLAVGFWKPHAHFNAPKKYWDLYDASEIKLADKSKPPQDVPPIALHDSREIRRAFKDRPGGTPTNEDARVLRHGYYAAISYVDAQVGKVIDELDRLGLRDNTIIVFWSDHGFHLGEHGLWAKTSNFELDARVPMIIASPDHDCGQQTEALVELLDLYPTLADLCGLKAPADLEGISLRPILNDPTVTVKNGALTQHCRPAYPAAGEKPDAMGYSLRTNRFRYTQWRDFRTGKILAEELYDHQHDPDETVNVASRDENEKTIVVLAKQLGALIERE